MNFTVSEQQQILAALGYGPHDEAPTFLTVTQPQYDRTVQILTQLINLDDQLFTNSTDAMALQVGDIKLSFAQHTVMVKSLGSGLLYELSAMTGVPIKRNKYIPRGSNTYFLDQH